MWIQKNLGTILYDLEINRIRLLENIYSGEWDFIKIRELPNRRNKIYLVNLEKYLYAKDLIITNKLKQMELECKIKELEMKIK